MKRLKNLATFLCVIFVFAALTSCMQSEAAKQADNFIAAIGTVSLDSEEAILAAEKAVKNLSQEEKESLRNLTVLDEARAEWNKQNRDHIVNEVIGAIDAIPDIKYIRLGNEEVVVTARFVYNSLIGDDQELQSFVTNYDKLTTAERTLLQIKSDKEKIESAISAIGAVTLDSEVAILNAREIYDEHPERVQAAVTNYSVLTSAEKTLEDLKIKQKVKPVEDLIDAIGNVTLESENAIAAAQAAYDLLSSNEAAMVSNYFTLKQAQAELQTAKKDEIFSRLTTETDKVSGITWYTSSAMPQYINKRSYVYPYIGVAKLPSGENYVWLRLLYNYYGNNWLGWDDLITWVDGQTYDNRFDSTKIQRDNSNRKVVEFCDFSLGSYSVPVGDDAYYARYSNAILQDEIELLWAIANSTEAIVRFQGDSKHYDLTVSAEDKAGIRDVLLAFEYLTEDIRAEIAKYD